MQNSNCFLVSLIKSKLNRVRRKYAQIVHSQKILSLNYTRLIWWDRKLIIEHVDVDLKTIIVLLTSILRRVQEFSVNRIIDLMTVYYCAWYVWIRIAVITYILTTPINIFKFEIVVVDRNKLDAIKWCWCGLPFYHSVISTLITIISSLVNNKMINNQLLKWTLFMPSVNTIVLLLLLVGLDFLIWIRHPTYIYLPIRHNQKFILIGNILARCMPAKYLSAYYI